MTTFFPPKTEQEDSASFLGDSPTVGKHPANGTADAGQFASVSVPTEPIAGCVLPEEIQAVVLPPADLDGNEAGAVSVRIGEAREGINCDRLAKLPDSRGGRNPLPPLHHNAQLLASPTKQERDAFNQNKGMTNGNS